MDTITPEQLEAIKAWGGTPEQYAIVHVMNLHRQGRAAEVRQFMAETGMKLEVVNVDGEDMVKITLLAAHGEQA